MRMTPSANSTLHYCCSEFVAIFVTEKTCLSRSRAALPGSVHPPGRTGARGHQPESRLHVEVAPPRRLALPLPDCAKPEGDWYGGESFS